MTMQMRTAEPGQLILDDVLDPAHSLRVAIAYDENGEVVFCCSIIEDHEEAVFTAPLKGSPIRAFLNYADYMVIEARKDLGITNRPANE